MVPLPYRAYYPGDDLFTPWQRTQGLPIGNLTSQLWANTYLACSRIQDFGQCFQLQHPVFAKYFDLGLLPSGDGGQLRLPPLPPKLGGQFVLLLDLHSHLGCDEPVLLIGSSPSLLG